MSANILPRFNAAMNAIEDERKVARIILDAGETPEPMTNPTRQLAKPGDPRVLRAIPVIARGVGGCIPGSNPLAALLLSDRTR